MIRSAMYSERKPLISQEFIDNLSKIPKVISIKSKISLSDDKVSTNGRNPERYRNITCTNLRVNHEKLNGRTYDDIKELLKNNHANLRCTIRPELMIATGYAKDVCLSSWCRGCPFIAGKNI